MGPMKLQPRQEETFDAPVRTIEVQQGSARAVFPNGRGVDVWPGKWIDCGDTAKVRLRGGSDGCRVKVTLTDEAEAAARKEAEHQARLEEKGEPLPPEEAARRFERAEAGEPLAAR